MTKYSGLSQLADTARELTDPLHATYPIKKKGEQRRLNPNWTGIAWLEAESFENTQPYNTYELCDGLEGVTTVGRMNGACRNYPRRIFDVFQLEDSSARLVHVEPCPDCDNWAYTSRCTEHTEPVWDKEKEKFVRPGQQDDGLVWRRIIQDPMASMFGSRPMSFPGLTPEAETARLQRRIEDLENRNIIVSFEVGERSSYRWQLSDGRWIEDVT